MSKHRYRTCDVCGDRIGHATHLRLRRFFLHGWLFRLCHWGIIAPDGDSGWRKDRVDVCEECWVDVTARIREEAQSDERDCDECGTGGGGLCSECKDDADVQPR